MRPQRENEPQDAQRRAAAFSLKLAERFFLKRRKENAVFGHRSRVENALAHLARGKQHTVLF